MANRFDCLIIGEGTLPILCAEILIRHGHEVLGLVSPDSTVQNWAPGRNLPYFEQIGDWTTFAGEQSFDYLFSINNHVILPGGVLARARKCAINYHDGLLPRYAGTHVTSWALMNRESVHAVTWHAMTDQVDAGDILKTHPVEIAPGETAFTLNTKCYEAAVTSFAELVEDLMLGRSAAIRQDLSQRAYFPRHMRPPTGCAIDWNRSAQDIDAFVRSLDFGPHPNPLGVPKLMAGGEAIVISKVEVLKPTSVAPPGTITGITQDSLKVSTASQELVIRKALTLEGQPLSIPDLVTRFGLYMGYRFSDLAPETARRVTELSASLCKHEPYWVSRLETLKPIALPLRAHTASQRGRGRHISVSQPAPVALPAFQEGQPDGSEFILAAFVAFLARLGGVYRFDLGFTDSQVRSDLAGLESFFSRLVPLRVNITPAQSFGEVLTAVREQVAWVRRHKTFARDLIARYPALRKGQRWPIVVEYVKEWDEHTTPPGNEITLMIREHGGEWRWVFDAAAVDESWVVKLTNQFADFLHGIAAQPGQRIAHLPLLTEDERRQILIEWNDTGADYPEHTCIHQLFEAQVERSPDAIAVVFQDSKLTYRELNDRANRLAHRLRELGVGPGVLVGICTDRSPEMVVALLGALKAGGAYVPLDPAYPKRRLETMLNDSQISALLTQERLIQSLPEHGARAVCVDTDWEINSSDTVENPISGVTADDLAYVIYTSGSTGAPRGVMVSHRNVVNFFTGMDRCIGEGPPGVWLAVTSISFDISVLELFWTLARGFKVVLHTVEEEGSRRKTSSKDIDFSLAYFTSYEGETAEDKYKLLIEGAKFADRHGFSAVWIPERHFHAFGGLFPNPSVIGAAIAAITERIAIRAGSVVLPLHNPIRVAEEWSIVDNLSKGRVGVSFASGWHANDFVFAPENYAGRTEHMYREIETVCRLWRGEAIGVQGGDGYDVEVKTLPRPVQRELPLWITSAGNPDTFRRAGEVGANLLTNMLGQTIEELAEKIALYRDAWRKHGHGPGEGHVTLMLHTFVGGGLEGVREKVRGPLCNYLKSSADLIKKTSWYFPAFSKPMRVGEKTPTPFFESEDIAQSDMEAMLAYAFNRYFESNGLFGTPDVCLQMVERLKAIGVDEIACLIDFGVDFDSTMSSLHYLDIVRENSKSREQYSIPALIRKHNVTHLQCTPSLARMLVSDPEALDSLRSLQKLMLGGEALPAALAEQLREATPADFYNMYGPTETTIWSTTYRVDKVESTVPIGRPIANTEIYILDQHLQPVPPGLPGEVFIGGAGVVRGYLNRPELTAERFLQNPFSNAGGARLYRTGDLARYRPDGNIEYLGRIDNQVKIRGHRIEPGEIEAMLGHHPAVQTAVVAAREDGAGDKRLVAYVIPKTSGARSNDHSLSTEWPADHVARWQQVWNEIYAEAPQSQDPTFNIVGWNSSYTGLPFSEAEMREWVNNAVNRIKSLRPNKVLEIGCGTGLLLFRIAPHCTRYCATDSSEAALHYLGQQLKTLGPGLPQVELRHSLADDLVWAGAETFDTVIINSVVQYFPSIDYLIRVLERAASAVRPGGAIFLGDVRSLPLLEAFHTSVQLYQAQSSLSVEDLKQGVQKQMTQEQEMVIDPAFFTALRQHIPRIKHVEIQLKRGHYHNELTRFRYDVILRIGSNDHPAVDCQWLNWGQQRLTLSAVSRILDETRSEALAITRVPNARLDTETRVLELLANGDRIDTIDDLRKALRDQEIDAEVDPEAIWDLGDKLRYSVVITHSDSGADACYDVIFRRDTEATGNIYQSSEETTSVRPWEQYANNPLQAALARDLIPRLRDFLAERLPEHMMPSAFVVLNALPLTPNGKLDRNSLPPPDGGRHGPGKTFAAPTGPVEEVLAGIWGKVLDLKRVGANDNFFELGGHSLLAVQLISRLRDTFHVELPLSVLFEAPTVKEMARALIAHESKPRQVEKIARILKKVESMTGEKIKAIEAQGRVKEIV